MEFLKGSGLLDRSFEVSITLKGLDGLLEIGGGILALTASPTRVNAIVATMTEHALSRNPHDFFATHLMMASHQFTGQAQTFAFLYLVSHGLAKVVLVVALWMNRLWAYPALIALLGIFILYQLYRMTYAPAWWLTALTIFDAVVIWLTWVEYKKQKKLKERKNGR